MAEPGNKNPAIDPAEGGSQEVGERMSSLETQLSQLTTLVSWLVEQQGVKVESSGFAAAAPGGGGPETSMHLSADATGGTAGGTGGDAQGLGVSSMRVGSSSLADSGLNPRVSAVNRSSVAAANFGSIGAVGGALGQSSVPPAPTLSSKLSLIHI